MRSAEAVVEPHERVSCAKGFLVPSRRDALRRCLGLLGNLSIGEIILDFSSGYASDSYSITPETLGI